MSLPVELVLPDVVWELFGGVDGNLVTTVTVVHSEQRGVGVKLKDGIANNFRQSADFKTAGGPVGNAFMNKSGAGFNLGTIMNFKKMEGINDMS